MERDTMLCHDPRTSNDRDDKRETENPALIQVELARQMFPDASVDWEDVARRADHCDWPVAAPR